MNERCFADKEKRCSVLEKKRCEGCKFYKTQEQFEQDARRAAYLHKKHMLEKEAK